MSYTTAISSHLLRPFNGSLSGTTRVSQHQKGKTSLDFTEARDSKWQWHQLGRMQVCTSLQTDKHASTPPLSFFTGRMPFLPPNWRWQQKSWRSNHKTNKNSSECYLPSKPETNPRRKFGDRKRSSSSGAVLHTRGQQSEDTETALHPCRCTIQQCLQKIYGFIGDWFSKKLTATFFMYFPKPNNYNCSAEITSVTKRKKKLSTSNDKMMNEYDNYKVNKQRQKYN